MSHEYIMMVNVICKDESIDTSRHERGEGLYSMTLASAAPIEEEDRPDYAQAEFEGLGLLDDDEDYDLSIYCVPSVSHVPMGDLREDLGRIQVR